MLISEIIFEDIQLAKNGTFDNAMSKMLNGYNNGLSHTHDTCYAYVGAHLAEIDPPDAVIRLWGLKASGLIVHGDALLPDGEVISDMPTDKYSKRGYELVRTITYKQLRGMLH